MTGRLEGDYQLSDISLQTPLITHRSTSNNTIPTANTIRASKQLPHVPVARPYGTIFAAAGLLLTTSLSLLVLVVNARRWQLDSNTYVLVTSNRASAQLIVQVLSNILGLIYIATICTLINYGTRIHFGKRTIRLDHLRLWHSLCTRTIDWTYSPQLLLPILGFIAITATPSAIWAGALTPVITTATSNATVLVPSYDTATQLREWPSEINSQGPVLRSNRGLFTYSVGVQMQGNLLASASSATPVDGSVRQHPKLDYSQYVYSGRSYGIGAAIGLMDDDVALEPLAQSYTFQESGYNAAVNCIYNSSSRYIIASNGASDRFAARGMLPNSGPAGEEFSVYYGHGTDAIVAIGVGRNWEDPRRMLAIAAGESYSHLDKVQCTVDFVPTRFNVSVGLTRQNITVTPDAVIPPLYPPASRGGNLTHVVMRQLELIANDQTNLYVSLVGQSLNASIGDYITALTSENTTTGRAIDLREVTLPGLENAFTAMLDDMLVAYASAQLMIAGQHTSTPAAVTSAAMRIGQDVYIYATFAVNLTIVLLITVEAIRTRGWRRLVALDYLDPASLVTSRVKADGGTSAVPVNSNVFGRQLLNVEPKQIGKVQVTLRRDLTLHLSRSAKPIYR